MNSNFLMMAGYQRQSIEYTFTRFGRILSWMVATGKLPSDFRVRLKHTAGWTIRKEYFRMFCVEPGYASRPPLGWYVVPGDVLRLWWSGNHVGESLKFYFSVTYR